MSFISNIVTILRGSIIAQIIGFAVLPLLSRLFAPEVFGVVQAATAIVTLALILSSLRLEVALLSVPEPQVDATWHAAAWLSVMTSLAAFVIVAILQWTGDALDAVRQVVWILPLIALLSGWNQIGNYLALRRSAFATVSNSRVVQTGTYASTAVAVGYVWPTSLGLMSADALGRLASVLYSARALGVRLGHALRPPTFKQVRDMLHAHRELTTVGLAAALINALGASFTALLMLWIFTAHDAGQYAIVERVVGAPISLIAVSASQVFMAHLSKALAGPAPGAAAQKIFRDVVKLNIKVAILPSIVLFFAAPIVLPWILGEGWEQAGAFARALSPLYFFVFITAPVNMALTIAGHQRLQLGWDTGRLVAMTCLWLTVWHLQLDANQAIWLHAATASFCYIVYLLTADRALARAAPVTGGATESRGTE